MKHNVSIGEACHVEVCTYLGILKKNLICLHSYFEESVEMERLQQTSQVCFPLLFTNICQETAEDLTEISRN